MRLHLRQKPWARMHDLEVVDVAARPMQKRRHTRVFASSRVSRQVMNSPVMQEARHIYSWCSMELVRDRDTPRRRIGVVKGRAGSFIHLMRLAGKIVRKFEGGRVQPHFPCWKKAVLQALDFRLSLQGKKPFFIEKGNHEMQK